MGEEWQFTDINNNKIPVDATRSFEVFPTLFNFCPMDLTPGLTAISEIPEAESLCLTIHSEFVTSKLAGTGMRPPDLLAIDEIEGSRVPSCPRT